MATPPLPGAPAPAGTTAFRSSNRTNTSAPIPRNGALSVTVPEPPRPMRTKSESAFPSAAPPLPPKSAYTHTRDISLHEPFVSTSSSALAQSMPHAATLEQVGRQRERTHTLTAPLSVRSLSSSLPELEAQRNYEHSESLRAEWTHEPNRTPDAWYTEPSTHSGQEASRTPEVWYTEPTHESLHTQRMRSGDSATLSSLPESAVPIPPDTSLHTPLHESVEDVAAFPAPPRHPAALASAALSRPCPSMGENAPPMDRAVSSSMSASSAARNERAVPPVPPPERLVPSSMVEKQVEPKPSPVVSGARSGPGEAMAPRPAAHTLSMPMPPAQPFTLPDRTPITEVPGLGPAVETPRSATRAHRLETAAPPPDLQQSSTPERPVAAERARVPISSATEHTRVQYTPTSAPSTGSLPTPVSGTSHVAQPPPPPAEAAHVLPSGGVQQAPSPVRTESNMDTLSNSSLSSDEEDKGDGDVTLAAPDHPSHASRRDEMLDISHMNRLPPDLNPPCSVTFKHQVAACDLFRDTLVAAVHDKIRVVTFDQGPQGFTDKFFLQGLEHFAHLGSPNYLSATSRELRITSLAFCPPIGVNATPETHTEPTEAGRFVWYGTINGHVGEFDVRTGQLTAICTNIHKERILFVRRIGQAMLVLDESGKISAWVPRPGKPLSLAHTTPYSQRITLAKQSYVGVVRDQLWVCTIATTPRSNPMQTSHKTLDIRIYNPLADDRPFNALAQPLTMPLTKENGIGAVLCSAIVPELGDKVFLGHESGHITVWSIKEPTCTDIHYLVDQPITATKGINSMLWTGTRTGDITLYDVLSPVWRAAKTWHAHREAVSSLVLDPYGLDPLSGELRVCSIGNDNVARFWDGFLSEDWVDNELDKCAASFSSARSLRVLQMTYNIGAAAPSDLFGVVENMELFQRVLRNSCAFSTASEASPHEYPDLYHSPDVIVFGFQELIDLEDKRQTAKRLLLGNKRREGKDTDSNVSSQHKAWHEQLINFVRLVLPPEAPYTVLLSESMVGLFTMVFVKTSLMPRTRSPVSYQVKTGLGGHYGNKGALVSRFIIDDTSLCFINCHLAAGQRNVRQRNSDVTVVMQSMFPVTPPKPRDIAFTGGGDGTMILDHEICFIAGDLNYRVDMRRDPVLQLVEQQRYGELTEADQLLIELRQNDAFRLRGFQEAPIHFPPTYKFNRLTNDWDSSEKARVPAYCDRILWRGHNTETVQCTSYKRWDATLSDHRPVSATFRVRVKSIDPVRRSQVLQTTLAHFAQYKCQVLAETQRFYQSL